MSAPAAIAANKPSASSMGADRSASVNMYHLAEGVENAIAHAVALASVAGILQQPHLRGVGGKGADHLGGLVARAIVNHDDLGGPAALADAADDRLERVGNPRASL